MKYDLLTQINEALKKKGGNHLNSAVSKILTTVNNSCFPEFNGLRFSEFEDADSEADLTTICLENCFGSTIRVDITSNTVVVKAAGIRVEYSYSDDCSCENIKEPELKLLSFNNDNNQIVIAPKEYDCDGKLYSLSIYSHIYKTNSTATYHNISLVKGIPSKVVPDYETVIKYYYGSVYSSSAGKFCICKEKDYLGEDNHFSMEVRINGDNELHRARKLGKEIDEYYHEVFDFEENNKTLKKILRKLERL